MENCSLYFAITLDRKQAIFQSHDNYSLIICNVSDGKIVKRLEAHTTIVTEIAITPDNKRVISLSYDGKLLVWDMVNGTIIAAYQFESDITCMAVNDDTIVVGDSDQNVHILSLRT